MTYKQYTPEELAAEVAKEQASKKIKVGDHVRLKSNGEYLGKVEEEMVIILVRNGSDEVLLTLAKDLELAPRLTPDEAWAELPYTVLAQLNQRMSWGAVRLTEYDQRAIRHECYKLLGGAGIKVTDEVKARVRKAIERIAEAMGVELA